MKTIATILLGLILLVPVWAKDQNVLTIHDLQLGCEAWARRDTPAETTLDILHSSETGGYIVGFTDATPDLDPPRTQVEVIDAVCKYIDLHPALWKLPRNTGLLVILHDLYRKPSKEPK